MIIIMIVTYPLKFRCSGMFSRRCCQVRCCVLHALIKSATDNAPIHEKLVFVFKISILSMISVSVTHRLALILVRHSLVRTRCRPPEPSQARRTACMGEI